MARNKFDIDETLTDSFNINHLKRLIGYIKPYYKEMGLTVMLMVLANCASLLAPYLVEISLDYKIPNKDIKGLAAISAVFLLSLVITGLCMKFRIRSMSRIGQNVLVTIREDVFKNLQRLPFSYYDSRPHGKILVRVVNYVNSLSDLLSNGLINLITDSLSLFIAIGFMLYINVKLTLISMIGMPILFTIILLIKNAQRHAFQTLSAKQSNMNAYIHESINGIKVTQSFAREEYNLNTFREVSNECRKSWMKAVKLQFIVWPSIEIISVLTVSLIYFVSVYYLSSEVTVGVLVAFVGYVWRFWMPIINIGNFYNQIVNAMAYLERIFETIDEKPLVTDAPNAVELPPISGEVIFDNVTFMYEEGEPILKNVSFKVNAGETIALVGPTGAGKTTIVNLISRFYNLNDGNVLIDGYDISTVTLKSLRKQMGIMLQDSFIFSGTIMDNIRYGKLDATDEEVIAAAKVVRAHDFIVQFEDGYNTEVNEKGTRLSVGQRQLISFARALLANPKILILDEATSSIDTKTELLLQEGLNNLLKGRTSFIIAHRLSTIKNATKILFIQDGQIVEAGTHDELIDLQGNYFNLYNAQFEFLNAV